jgi:hypothetical protein
VSPLLSRLECQERVNRMSSEVQREVFRVLRESQSKYTYFLLAAAGAAIGFALTQTQGESLAYTQVPLAIAVFLWAGSFFCGCRHLAYVNSTLYANAEMLQIESGMNPQVGSHPQYIQAASQGIRKVIEKNSDSANRLGHWQFRLLIKWGSLLCFVARLGNGGAHIILTKMMCAHSSNSVNAHRLFRCRSKTVRVC